MMSSLPMWSWVPMAGRLKEARVHYMTCMCMSECSCLSMRRKAKVLITVS